MTEHDALRKEKEALINVCNEVLSTLRENSDMMVDHQIALEEKLANQIAQLSSAPQDNEIKAMLETTTHTRDVVHSVGWEAIHFLGEQIRFIKNQKKNIREAQNSERVLCIADAIACCLNKRPKLQEV